MKFWPFLVFSGDKLLLRASGMIDYLHYGGGIDFWSIQGSRGNVWEFLRGRGTVCEEECWKEENLGMPKTGEKWCLEMEEILCAHLSTDVPTFLLLTLPTNRLSASVLISCCPSFSVLPNAEPTISDAPSGTHTTRSKNYLITSTSFLPSVHNNPTLFYSPRTS